MTKLKDTNHDYGGIIPGNFYSNEPNGFYNSWNKFKNEWWGFHSKKPPFENYDDTYHFLFRFDVNKYCNEDNCKYLNCQEEGINHDSIYELELYFLLQRKGIYSKVTIHDISEEDWKEIQIWLKGRKAYLDKVWSGI